MIKTILKTICVLISIVVVAFVSAAVVIPAKKTYTQETVVSASRETIWEILHDKAKYPEWQDKLTKVEIKDEKNWTEYTKNTEPLEFTEVSSEEPAGLKLKYRMGDSFKGEWSGELRRITPEKTILRTTDTTEVNSVVMKVMMAMFFDIEDFAKDWNQRLKKRAESAPAAK